MVVGACFSPCNCVLRLSSPTPDSDSDGDSDEFDAEPILEYKSVAHRGGVNRIRALPQQVGIVWLSE